LPETFKHHISRRCAMIGAMGGLASLTSLPLRAQAAARVVFGFSSGASMADLARDFIPELSAASGMHFGPDLVYMPGNNAAKAMAHVHAAAHDGHTLLLTAATTMTLAPLLKTLPNLKPDQDFTPVAMLAEFPWVFCVNSALVPESVNTPVAYLKWVQQHPDRGAFATPGPGSCPHAVGLRMAQVTETPMRAQAYPGVGALSKDLTGGGVPAGFLSPGPARAASNIGLLRPLFVTSKSRWRTFPDVPTLQQALAIDLAVTDNYGLFVDSRTKPEVVERLHAAVTQALKTTRVQAAVERISMQARILSAQQYRNELTAERDMWRVSLDKNKIYMEG
jgi:tripartite-type tricarboxylate transporter receptor subunit TctC